MTPHSRFDRAVLDQLERKIGRQNLGEVIDLFCADGPRRLRAVQDAQRRADLEASAEALHSIRGSAAMLGLHSLDELVSRAEGLAGEGDVDGVEALIDDLEGAYTEAVAFLRRRREQLER